MSPLMMRIFTLVGIALAAASLQLKVRAETLPAAGSAVHADVQAAGSSRPY